MRIEKYNITLKEVLQQLLRNLVRNIREGETDSYLDLQRLAVMSTSTEAMSVGVACLLPPSLGMTMPSPWKQARTIVAAQHCGL